jgi:dTDP-4-amino-4,6-dideoxygalactose transaminase
MMHFSQPDHMGTMQTFWQFVIRVDNVAVARDMLFRKGIETDTTQLMDLANASGLVLPNAQALKSEHIFVPLHQHLLPKDYIKFFRALNNVN